MINEIKFVIWIKYFQKYALFLFFSLLKTWANKYEYIQHNAYVKQWNAGYFPLC